MPLTLHSATPFGNVTMSLEESGSFAEEQAQLIASSSAVAYMDTRYQSYRESFGSLADEFDYIYHELTVSGSLTSSGSWYKTIKGIKDANPKP